MHSAILPAMKIKDMTPEGQRAYRQAQTARRSLTKALALMPQMSLQELRQDGPFMEQIEELRQVAEEGLRGA